MQKTYNSSMPNSFISFIAHLSKKKKKMKEKLIVAAFDTVT
jgi:hypothetical protein